MGKKSLSNKTSARIHKLAATTGAVITLIGAATGVCSWVSDQFRAAISAQISDFQNETRETDKRHEQAVTRVELVMLMEHDPENTVAIEQMARYYFDTLGGDKYMTGKYSAWAKEYGGDTSIVLGGK